MITSFWIVGMGASLNRWGPIGLFAQKHKRSGHQRLVKMHGQTQMANLYQRVRSPARRADGGKWRLSPHLPEERVINYDGISFNAMPTPFRHLGFFPEQSAHWQWCAERIRGFITRHNRAPKVMNLFGYTGVASLHAAMAGAEVTHVDSSKKAVAQAFANRDQAGYQDKPIRFITEDARSFVKREIRRGNLYDGVILDP